MAAALKLTRRLSRFRRRTNSSELLQYGEVCSFLLTTGSNGWLANYVFVGIDLANLIAKHDTTASDIVSHQRDSLVQRKDLAQKTKDFRKLDDASKLSEYKGLLKCVYL